MSWSNPNSPNLPDFILFAQNSMGIDPLYLPSTSPFFGYAFNQAMAVVNNLPANVGIEYTLAVYNCAGHILIKIAPDQTGRTYFQDARKTYGMLLLSAGVVQSASDESTSESLAVPDAVRQLTIGDLQFLKTPWGRDYLSYAQDFGGIFGIS